MLVCYRFQNLVLKIRQTQNTTYTSKMVCKFMKKKKQCYLNFVKTCCIKLVFR